MVCGYERGMTYIILACNICGIFTLHWEGDGIIASINVELSDVLTAEGLLIIYRGESGGNLCWLSNPRKKSWGLVVQFAWIQWSRRLPLFVGTFSARLVFIVQSLHKRSAPHVGKSSATRMYTVYTFSLALSKRCKGCLLYPWPGQGTMHSNTWLQKPNGKQFLLKQGRWCNVSKSAEGNVGKLQAK
jgi:hypothetical protein